MFSKVLIASALISGAVATFEADWESFKVTYGKTYKSKDEEKVRFNIFNDNMKLIDERNAKDTAKYGITKFADLTPREFSKRFTNYKPSQKKQTPTEFHKFDLESHNEAAPKDGDGLIDWTGKYTTPVKDQGQCGSCWAFSAVEQIESDYIRTQDGPMSTILSAQQVNSCTVYDDDGDDGADDTAPAEDDGAGDDDGADDDGGGCGGGLTEVAFEYAEAGIELDFYYPYTSGAAGVSGDCTSDASKFVVQTIGYTTVSNTSAGESIMASYVQETGPLSICVDASAWQYYTGGILSTCGDDVDHCVQVVGVNTDEGYWKVRNSWGADWAEDGFIRLSYGNNTCQIASDAIYAEVEAFKQ